MTGTTISQGRRVGKRGGAKEEARGAVQGGRGVNVMPMLQAVATRPDEAAAMHFSKGAGLLAAE
jgi:hypothetical protein